MKNDRIIRFSLSVIAFCLLILTSQKIYNIVIPPAEAKLPPQTIDLLYKGAMLGVMQAQLCVSTLGISETSCQELTQGAMQNSSMVVTEISSAL